MTTAEVCREHWLTTILFTQNLNHKMNEMVKKKLIHGGLQKIDLISRMNLRQFSSRLRSDEKDFKNLK